MSISVDTLPHGQLRLTGIVHFMVMTPTEKILHWSSRRRMKDACMEFERRTGMHWSDALSKGYRVMKCFTHAIDKSDESERSVGDWVEWVDDDEPAPPKSES